MIFPSGGSTLFIVFWFFFFLYYFVLVWENLKLCSHMVRFCLLLTCSGIYTTSSVKLFCVIKQISSFWLLNVSSGLRTRGHISACRSGIYSCLSISLLQNKQLWNTEPHVWAGEGQFMKKSCFLVLLLSAIIENWRCLCHWSQLTANT